MVIMGFDEEQRLEGVRHWNMVALENVCQIYNASYNYMKSFVITIWQSAFAKWATMNIMRTCWASTDD